jgi:hypothetical protein
MPTGGDLEGAYPNQLNKLNQPLTNYHAISKNQ